jgi:uncharacterized protein (UPF0332 family)
MGKLSWCLKQKRGVSLIEIKPHLKESYLKDAEKSLEVCLNLKGKWKLITGYYACYNALYSILMACGIKSEIHDCSIKLMDLFGFSKQDIEFLENLKEDRIKVQYYLKEIPFKDEAKAKNFIVKCKEILEILSSSKIEEIRNKIKRAKNE